MNWKVFVKLCTAASMMSVVGAVSVGPVSVYAATATNPLLRPGDHGPDVQKLQTDLNAAGYSVGKADGILGPGTEAVLKKFQTDHHLTADGIVGAGTWKAIEAAMGPTAADLHQSSISFNSKLVSTQKAFAWQGTTYMPIYYVQQLLKQLDFKTGWDGTHWTLTTPSNSSPDLSNLPINKQQPGDMDISLNGTVVAYMKGIVFKDPASGVATTYMPIWYVMQALKHMNFTTSWDGQHWDLKRTVTYTIYDKKGTQVNSTTPYSSEADAQAALANVPGGTVRDNTGQVVFTEPDYTAYQKDGKTVVGDFTTLQPAEAAVAQIAGATVTDWTGQVVYTTPDFEAFTSPLGAPTDYTDETQAATAIAGQTSGYVVDKQTNKVVIGPVDYEYVDNTGSWHSTMSGAIGTAPAFAAVGDKYVSVTPSGSNTAQIYLISLADGTYAGTLQGGTGNPFQTIDLRQLAPASVTGQQIDRWFQSNQSPLAGLGQDFVSAQNKYGVDATYLVAHAVEESGWGKSAIAKAKNNLFGYGAYDSNPAHDAGMFPTNEYAIRYEAWVVRNSYLEPSGPFYDNPTLNGMNVHYATDPLWAKDIANLMSQYVSQTGGSASDYKQFSIGMSGPIPAGSQEPVFFVSGAQGSVLNTAYGNLPVYSDPSVGSGQMFPGPLQLGSSGQAVRTLQQALLNAALQPDGAYGPLTQSAVKDWQQSHGLPVTGVCDLSTWLSLFPAPHTTLAVGSKVSIDQMKQGMLGNLVTLWYHVTGANGVTGWVDSEYVSPQVTSGNESLTDIFRVQASSGTTVPVYGSESTTGSTIGTLHNGDEVVTTAMYAVDGPFTPDAKGFIAIKWVNQATGQAQTGYLQAAMTPLTPPTPVYTSGHS